ncbi:MAG TPA: tripartite tricarboxylate transporter substrate binding protein, partial [Burkholderiales bacterium]|nr:tripartite tricarboxylate transporter substrate binding protein [Burkholderiales bacterium]
MRRIAAALFIAVAFSGGAAAQAWPEKPVRFIVGFTPGGPSDILARALGQKLAELWTQQVVIENRPGAGGNI